jgi:hypothetical protein
MRPASFSTASTAAALLLLPAGAALAQGTAPGAGAKASATTVVPVAGLTWGPAPAALPAGARLAVLEGDPTKAGPYTIRLRLPAGYRFPPHTHPGAEHVTVMSGTLLVAAGERLGAAEMRALPAGSYTGIPADVRHAATTRGETVLQIHGMGPFGIAYVNTADDPAAKAAPPR